MPFIAVVYVQDDDEAREFLGFMHDDDAATVGRLVGLYRFPKRDVKLCRGFGGGCRHGMSYKRHRLGHYVHACGLRVPDWWRRIRGTLLDLFGMNLLPRNQTPGLFRNPDGYEPDYVFEFGDSSTKKK